jgi:hypothetical protein
MYIGTNNTTALTLDSSQRTIANGVFWSSSTGNTSTNGFNNATAIANNLISLYGSTGSANIQIAGRVTTHDGGSGYYGLKLQAPTSAYPDFSGTVTWTDALTLTSQNATFAVTVKVSPEAGYDSYIGYSTNRDSYLTAKNAGSHFLRGYDGSTYVNWAEFTRNRVFLVNTASAPASNPTGGGFLYVEAGALKYRGSSGTVTTIANA